jgi:hypothetical protein
MRPKSLLRPNSGYVVPSVYELNDLWHSYTGHFSKIDEFVKRLTNINVDCLDENIQGGNSRRIVAIGTIITDMLNQPGYTPFAAAASDAMAFFQRQVPALHAANKSTLMGLIDDRMCKRIGLEANT